MESLQWRRRPEIADESVPCLSWSNVSWAFRSWERGLEFKGGSLHDGFWAVSAVLEAPCSPFACPAKYRTKRQPWRFWLGNGKRVITKGVFSLEKSLEFLKSSQFSRISRKWCRNLLCFPQSGGSLKTLESLNAPESLVKKMDFFEKTTFPKTLFSKPDWWFWWFRRGRSWHFWGAPIFHPGVPKLFKQAF